MFNNSVKEWYINTLIENKGDNNQVVGYVKRQFKISEKYEQSLNKDLCNFTEKEIINYFKALNYACYDSLLLLCGVLIRYTQWCLSNNLVLDGQNHFDNLNREIIYEKCLNKFLVDKSILSEIEVFDMVDELPNPKDKFVLLCLYEGIKGKDFCEISKMRPSDVNGNTATLSTNRTVKISNKLLQVIHECEEENTYYSMSDSCLKTMPLKDFGYILKEYPNVEIDVSEYQLGRRVYNSITRILKYYKMVKFCSAQSIYESGKINSIIKKAKELDMPVRDFIYSSYIEEIEKQYNSKIIKSVFTVKYSEQLGI